MKNALKDSSNRIITYLRISITDNCNFRCAYCSPNGLVDKITNGAILSAGETVRLAGIFASLGVKKVRLTGGEPLLRRELSEIIRGIKGFPEIGDISITTNGVLLGRLSAELKEAGLNRINMSVPSLNAARYREITGGGNLEDAVVGLRSAIRAGMRVKVNVVACAPVIVEEIADYMKLAESDCAEIRFIEYMPLCGGEYKAGEFVDLSVLRDDIVKRHCLEKAAFTDSGESVAEVFSRKDWAGSIGFITPISKPFCDACTRIRITADGFIRPCLFSPIKYGLRDALRNGASDEEIGEIIFTAAANKPAAHPYAESLAGVCEIPALIRTTGG